MSVTVRSRLGYQSSRVEGGWCHEPLREAHSGNRFVGLFVLLPRAGTSLVVMDSKEMPVKKKASFFFSCCSLRKKRSKILEGKGYMDEAFTSHTPPRYWAW